MITTGSKCMIVLFAGWALQYGAGNVAGTIPTIHLDWCKGAVIPNMLGICRLDCGIPLDGPNNEVDEMFNASPDGLLRVLKP